jgi:hypothetical protein
MEDNSGAREWCGLLQETRRALSTLRAEDLEELAARAERIFEMNPCLEPTKRAGSEVLRSDMASLTRERHLLGDLMLATHRNRRVLQRLHRGASGHPGTEGVEQRWVL